MEKAEVRYRIHQVIQVRRLVVGLRWQAGGLDTATLPCNFGFRLHHVSSFAARFVAFDCTCTIFPSEIEITRSAISAITAL